MMASSSSSKNSRTQHGVFISFRGEDVRYHLLSHLKKELQRKSIDFYVDDKDLKSGEEIAPSLLRAIDESLISLIIFSENYADSQWCLDELAKIMECKQNNQKIVIPVFYKIDPTVVRRETGSYKDAFKKHGERYKEEKLQIWRSALSGAANLSGICSSDYKDEAELVENIVESLSKRLTKMYSPSETRNLVGIDKKIGELQSLMHQNSQDVCVIGVWGMGGIGKTTLAAEVFNRFHRRYGGFCFFENVREEFQKNGGVLPLKKKLFSTLLNEKDLNIDIPNVLPNLVEKKLGGTKIFLVLDDINDSTQFENLVGKLDCFHRGSVIIITTRDKDVLSGVAMVVAKGVAIKTFEIEPLTSEEELELFKLHAFKENCTDKELLALSRRVIEYAKKLPLAVKVLASLLRNKNKQEWESQLEKLKNMPIEKIHKVLRLSYDTLDRQQKDIFLYIACHFGGYTKDEIIYVLHACGFSSTADELKVLKDNALITWTPEESIVSMHDLIAEMGKEIVREESKRDPGKYRHLWDSNEICDVLRNDKGSKYIESIILDEIIGGSNLLLSPQVFSRMNKLKILKIFRSYREDLPIKLPEGLQSFRDELRFLCWEVCPLKYLPFTSAKNLVQLEMRESKLQKLWDGEMPLENLKKIDLSGSKNLVGLPNLSSAKNLEEVLLLECESLCVVHPYILSLPKLKTLSLEFCTNLTHLQSDIHLNSLSYLFLDGCQRLKEFSVTSENMIRLNLAWTTIKEFLFSTGSFRRLEFLSVAECKSLTHLPNNLVDLTSLRTLHIFGCEQLQSLPQLPSSIEKLQASNCTSLKTIQFSFKHGIPFNKKLVSIGLKKCEKLDGQSREAIQSIALSNLTSYAHKSVDERKKLRDEYCINGEFIYSGWEVPKWFRHTTEKGSITICPHSKLLGFIFCFVRWDYWIVDFDVNWFWKFNDDEILNGECFKFNRRYFEDRSSDSCGSQVYICYTECSGKINERIKESRRQVHQNSRLSLKFFRWDEHWKLVPIVMCGVHPIYAKDDDDEHDGEEEVYKDSDDDDDEEESWKMRVARRRWQRVKENLDYEDEDENLQMEEKYEGSDDPFPILPRIYDGGSDYRYPIMPIYNHNLGDDEEVSWRTRNQIYIPKYDLKLGRRWQRAKENLDDELGSESSTGDEH